MTIGGLYIFGFGGHARSVGDVALAAGVRALVFIDATAQPGESCFGFPVLQRAPEEMETGWGSFPAVGDNTRRRDLCAIIPSYQPALVAPTASFSRCATLSDAAFVGHQAHVGPYAKIGRGVIINSGAVFDHESQIGDFSHVAVNATIAGRCKLGNRVFIGAGATLIDGVRIADEVIVGAGATVTQDLLEPGVYVGTPARLIPR